MFTYSYHIEYPEKYPFRTIVLPDEWQVHLEELYSEPHRHYHTVDHISALIHLFYDLFHRFKNPKAVLYAILFHDAIYDPTSTVRGENEERSIALFKKFAAEVEEVTLLRVSERDVKAVEIMIRATITHTIPDQTELWDYHLPRFHWTFNPFANLIRIADAIEEMFTPIVPPQDIALFLDLDLSILASARPKYEGYMRSIRFEYNHYGDLDYRAGRTAVLLGFLAREKLFFSTVAEREDWESRARENIGYEFALLSGGALPPAASESASPEVSTDTKLKTADTQTEASGSHSWDWIVVESVTHMVEMSLALLIMAHTFTGACKLQWDDGVLRVLRYFSPLLLLNVLVSILKYGGGTHLCGMPMRGVEGSVVRLALVIVGLHFGMRMMIKMGHCQNSG